MTSKSKQVIMAAVGAYLVYTGVSLVRETIAGEPDFVYSGGSIFCNIRTGYDCS